MNNFEGTLELKSPLTKECWDKLVDVELENTERMWFTTPSEKRIEYIKASVLDEIRAEIRAEIDRQYKWLINTRYTIRDVDIAFGSIFRIIDKYKAESEDKE